jgi:protoporphyrinogen oxidase
MNIPDSDDPFAAIRSKSDSPNSLVLGGGIGGLCAAYSLLQMGQRVILIEKSDALGGLLKSVDFAGMKLDMGQKQFYDRIPEVHDFFLQLLGETGYSQFPHRVGLEYNGRIYEREKHFRGWRRGMSWPMMAMGLTDLVMQRARYKLKSILTLEDQAWALKGRMFSRIFSQGFDEKLKTRLWSQISVRSPLTSPTQNSDSAQWGRQHRWWHPWGGTDALITHLRNQVIEMGGKILLNTFVQSIIQKQHSISSLLLSSGNHVCEVTPKFIFSTLPLDAMAHLLDIPFAPANHEVSFRRGVIMVFMLFDESSRFPHTSLWINSPQLRIGRVNNYSAYNCGMVPEGKSCLSFEFFIQSGDSLLKESDEAIIARVKQEFNSKLLFDEARLTNATVLRFPFSDPAASWDDYEIESTRRVVFEHLAAISNLYHLNRTGIDRSVHAALLAVEASQTNSKEKFLRESSPFQPRPWLNVNPQS